jgi:hypothetical protein
VATFAIAAALMSHNAAQADTAKKKFVDEEIDVEETCDNEGSVPLKDCMQAIGDAFCKSKGHETYLMVSWAAIGGGKSKPNRIQCK